MAQQVVNDVAPGHVEPASRDWSRLLLRWTATALVAMVWLSVALFGLYILAFYAGALLDGELEGWNEVLPRLYEPTTPAATAGIALHFAAGGVRFLLCLYSR